MGRLGLGIAVLVLPLVAVVTLSARELGPSSRPAEEPAASSSTPPTPATTCVADGGVAIGVGDDAQSVVHQHGAGTTYIVKAGTHLRNFSVQPKAGDTFCGEPGAVLDGGRRLRTAFSGGASKVTLDSIVVRDYNCGKLGGTIQRTRVPVVDLERLKGVSAHVPPAPRWMRS